MQKNKNENRKHNKPSGPIRNLFFSKNRILIDRDGSCITYNNQPLLLRAVRTPQEVEYT